MAPAGEAAERFRLGRVVTRSFAIWGRELPLLLALALVIHAPRVVAEESLWAMTPDPMELDARWRLANYEAFFYGNLLLESLFTNLSQASVIFLVCARLGGRPATFSGSARGGARRFLPVLGVSLLVFGLFVLVSVALSFLTVHALLAGWIAERSIHWAFLLANATSLVLLGPLWVAVPAAVVEPSGGLLRRSWRLTRGHRLAVCAILLLLHALDLGSGYLVGFTSADLPWLARKTLLWTSSPSR